MLRSVGGPPLHGKCAADFYRRCHSQEQVTVSDAVMRQLVRLAQEQDERDRVAWGTRLAMRPARARGGWCAAVDGVIVAHGRSRQNARNRALQLLSDFTSSAPIEQVAAQLGLPLDATPPPAPPASCDLPPLVWEGTEGGT